MFNIIATFHEPRAFTAAEREQRKIETTELSNGHAETNNNTINNEKEEKYEDFKYIQVIKNSSIWLQIIGGPHIRLFTLVLIEPH